MNEQINNAVIKIDTQLKKFQAASVKYVLDQLYTINRNKVLIADEVGLGKTIIAKGVIAKATQLYKKPMQTEEFLSEALGLISEKFDIIRRNSKALNSVTNFVESIASLLGLGKAKKELSKDPDRVLRALVMVAKKIQNNEAKEKWQFTQDKNVFFDLYNKTKSKALKLKMFHFAIEEGFINA